MCAAPKDLQEVADRHGTVRPPRHVGCESRRRLVRIVPPIYGLWHCFTHNSCVCNDVISCVNRVVGKTPLPTQEGLQRLRATAKIISRKIGDLVPLTLEEALATFKGTKHKLYQRAYESLKVKPLSERDSVIKAFVKAEKFNPEDKENPDPRMIQARDPRYNLHLSRFLRPLEHKIYSLQLGKSRAIAKGLNPKQRAELLWQKWTMFSDPVCVSLDCSRWDKHVSLEVLDIEHAVYQRAYPGNNELQQLLGWQRINKCVTQNKLRYKVVGGRMSGDMNTASGNCLLMFTMVVTSMKNLGVRKYQIIDDGDDVLVIVERSDLETLKEKLPNEFLSYGQELKLENITDKYEEVDFCQAKPTWNGTEFVFARNWRKVLSQSCCGTKHWNDSHMVPGMFGLLGDCELAQHAGIPILQAFAIRLRQLSGGARARMVHMDSSYQYRIGSWYRDTDLSTIQPKEITAFARYMFSKNWNVPVASQIEIERQIMAWTPDIYYRDVPQEFLEGQWQQLTDPSIPLPTVL